MRFSWESAYWVNSAVARLVYQDYARASPVVTCARRSFEQWATPAAAAADEEARSRFQTGDTEGAAAALTAVAVQAGAEATSRWTELWQRLMVTFQDGSMASEDPNDHLCGCAKTAPQWSDEWLVKVVNDTGDHYRLPSKGCEYIDPDGHCHPHPPARKAPPVRVTPGFGAWFAHGFAPVPTTFAHRHGSAGSRLLTRPSGQPPLRRADLEPIPKLVVRGVMG